MLGVGSWIDQGPHLGIRVLKRVHPIDQKTSDRFTGTVVFCVRCGLSCLWDARRCCRCGMRKTHWTDDSHRLGWVGLRWIGPDPYQISHISYAWCLRLQSQPASRSGAKGASLSPKITRSLPSNHVRWRPEWGVCACVRGERRIASYATKTQKHRLHWQMMISSWGRNNTRERERKRYFDDWLIG